MKNKLQNLTLRCNDISQNNNNKERKINEKKVNK